PERYRPRWQVGQQWVVESVNTQMQTRRGPQQAPAAQSLQWQFQVQGVERIGPRDCFRIQVGCQHGGQQQPMTTLWMDQQSLALQQLQTQLPVQGGFRTITESYRTAGGQPAPVIAPLTVLPLEMPVLLQGGKGLEKFTYEATAGTFGTKAVG